jgi:hypothetical protein
MSTFLGTKYSEQNILNESFDKDFGVLAVELLGYDPISDSVKRVTIDALNHYATNDTDNTDPNNFYEGLEDAEGSWQIALITKDGTIEHHRFATNKNNPTYTSYASAFTDRATLTYDYYSVAF